VPDPETLRKIFSDLGFVTTGKGMTVVLQFAYKAAQASDTTVLLQGETGTGKQVLARAIHRLDEKRRRFPFVTVHCSTVRVWPRASSSGTAGAPSPVPSTPGPDCSRPRRTGRSSSTMSTTCR
jgi:hypothetical protein